MNIYLCADDPVSATYLAFTLHSAGHTVVRRPTRSRPEQLLQAGEPDLVVFDIAHPHTPAFDLCHQLRRCSDVPILFVGSLTDVDSRVRGLQVGGDDYVVKPIEEPELLARVTAVARRSAWGNKRCITHGPIVISPFTGTVSIRRRTIPLTALEFKVLWFLAQHTNQVLSAQQIRAHVWDGPHTAPLKTVAMCLSRLRNKLHHDAGHHIRIVTIWNKGYRLEIQSQGVETGRRNAVI